MQLVSGLRLSLDVTILSDWTQLANGQLTVETMKVLNSSGIPQCDHPHTYSNESLTTFNLKSGYLCWFLWKRKARGTTSENLHIIQYVYNDKDNIIVCHVPNNTWQHYITFCEMLCNVLPSEYIFLQLCFVIILEYHWVNWIMVDNDNGCHFHRPRRNMHMYMEVANNLVTKELLR